MSRRVSQLVVTAGGCVREDAVVAQLAKHYGRQWALAAVHFALMDGVVLRRYADGADALVIPDDDPRDERAA
jgi:hypothetical protein